MHLQHRTRHCPAPTLRLATLQISVASTTWAHADDTVSRTSWSLRGFGSAGVAYSSFTDGDYNSSLLKSTGVGYSHRISADVDSRLGAQLAVKAGKQWSAVLQVVSEQRIDGSYKPAVEWANIKYEIYPDVSLRFGRIALPMFLAADYRKVGYAYPWARTPVEVYGAIPFSNSDGVDATWRWSSGALKNVTHGFIGRTEVVAPGNTHLKARELAGISNTAAIGAATFRVSMLTTELTMTELDGYFDGLRQFSAQGAALAGHYGVDHKRASAVSIGASYDPGDWFAMGELGRMNSRSFIGATTGLYASAGYRFGDFTPYVSYARVRSTSGTDEPGLDLAGLPPAAAATGAGLNAYLGWLLTTIPAQRTLSVGMRWDCATDVAFKLQVDRITPMGGSRGTFVNLQPGFRSGRGVNVASAVLDFVF
jgi:hypothetical protein